MLIDSHCHIPHKKYDKSVDEIINEAKEVGVTKLITIGTSVFENKLAIETAEKYKDVYATVAIYPHDDIDKNLDELERSLEESLKSSRKVVALGECGMDITNWKGGRSIAEQVELFEMQLNLATRHNLPVVIHNRNGDKEVINLLEKYVSQGLRGVIHCFASDWEFGKKCLDLGFYLSFTALITYPGRDEVREVLQKVPMDKFLIETDAPYLPPQGHRGETNYSKYVKIVAEKASEIKQKSFEEICEATYQNTCSLFKLNDK